MTDAQQDPSRSAAELLHQWLRRQLSDAAASWLDASTAKVACPDAKDRDLWLAISLAQRKVGKDDLALSDADLAAAEDCRSGWDPRGWSADQAARVALLLAMRTPPQVFLARLDSLCSTADVGELVAFYRGLPLYPAPELYRARAAEGVRTNMRAVFEAVAHRNPYPREQLDQDAWNQMVLKALFIGAPLHPIQGIDERANPDLAQMLCDYADERRSAHRPVSPELWRGVGPFATGQVIADLELLLGSSDELEREAAVLALRASPDQRAGEVLMQRTDLDSAAEKEYITWETVGRDCEARS